MILVFPRKRSHPVIYTPGDNEWTDCWERQSGGFKPTVLIAHGDDHKYTIDHPVVRSATRRRLENVTQLEVPGSPQVGWVRVVVTPGADNPFAFESHIIPRWKYW